MMWVVALAVLPVAANRAYAKMTVGDICRIKGQERNTLQGMGLVVGLKGTGDGTFSPTALSLIQIMTNMGVPLSSGAASTGANAQATAPLLKDAKNVALVVVTAEIPEEGGRQGCEFECTVSAVNAKSLKGGTLLLTPMLGPLPPGEHPEDARIYAFCRGRVQLDNPENPTTAMIPVGCRLETTVMNPFIKDNRMTLVLNRFHANFQMAQEIALSVNQAFSLEQKQSQSRIDNAPEIARAVDQLTIEVAIPEAYLGRPVDFASEILSVKIMNPPLIEMVVVNETTGVITISQDLEIDPNAVTHENMVVEIGNGVLASQFVGFAPEQNTSVPTLQALVQALNSLRVPANDVIAIIRSLDRKGAIHGRVIYE